MEKQQHEQPEKTKPLQHPDWVREEAHLNNTLSLVAHALKDSNASKKNIDSEVQRLTETGDPDSSIDYVDLSVNLLIQGSLELKLRNLLEASSKPYFARIDFIEDGTDILQPIYIGKMVLIREEDMKPVIIDWRSPIASLYYEERLGDAHYLAPRGDIKGQMSLKRQYTIDKGKLENLFDIDITTNDTFLQSYLGASADTRLKDIVSTIQAEQNRIIRADMWTPLIVQGAAGSGKTTIALHRIAYLVYTHEKTFQPENFMIIAPNTLFLNYISEILPELGVDRVRQTTFEDFAMDLIGKRFKLRDPNEKLMVIAENKDPVWARQLAEASRLKASTAYKTLLDSFMDETEEKMLPKEDLVVFDELLMTRRELNELFTVAYRRWPVKNRLDEVKKHMVNMGKRRKNSIAAKIERKCTEHVNALIDGHQEGLDRTDAVKQTGLEAIKEAEMKAEGMQKCAEQSAIAAVAVAKQEAVLLLKEAEKQKKSAADMQQLAAKQADKVTEVSKQSEKKITEAGESGAQTVASAVRQAEKANTAQKKVLDVADAAMRIEIRGLYDERDSQLHHINKEIAGAIRSYLSGITKPTAFDFYVQFIAWLKERAQSPEEAFVAEWSARVLAEKKIEQEDLAALIHLRYRIHGLDEKIPVRHIVIDEAQDFSAFQLDVVKRIIPDSSFTILGDLCQGIHSYRSLSNWEEIQEGVFGDRKSKVLTLEQSYRTTVEIMDAANLISKKMAIPGVPQAKPVIRYGEPVVLQVHPEDYAMKEHCAHMGARLQEWLDKGMKLLAVIGKTVAECQEIYSCLHRSLPQIHLISGTEGEYSGGVMVVPAHLSKGLEFDAVIIADASADRYSDSLMDAKLLYVAATRAMHVLDIHSLGVPTSLFEGLAGYMT